MKKNNNSKKNQKKSLFAVFIDNIYLLNSSKFFAGMIMLTLNIGSKYVTLELSKTQEDYIRYTLGRQILVFAILWMGTRDIVVALTLTCVFILFADYLLNDSSYYCILPDKCNVKDNKNITKKEINDAIQILKKARKQKCPNKSHIEDTYIKKGLYKENFI
jgi:hypothetical protein